MYICTGCHRSGISNLEKTCINDLNVGYMIRMFVDNTNIDAVLGSEQDCLSLKENIDQLRNDEIKGRSNWGDRGGVSDYRHIEPINRG